MQSIWSSLNCKNEVRQQTAVCIGIPITTEYEKSSAYVGGFSSLLTLTNVSRHCLRSPVTAIEIKIHRRYALVHISVDVRSEDHTLNITSTKHANVNNYQTLALVVFSERQQRDLEDRWGIWVGLVRGGEVANDNQARIKQHTLSLIITRTAPSVALPVNFHSG